MTGTRAEPSLTTASILQSLAGPCTTSRVRVVCVCMPRAWHTPSAAAPTSQWGLEPGGLPGITSVPVSVRGASCPPGPCRTAPARRPSCRDGHGPWLRLLVPGPDPLYAEGRRGGRRPLVPQLTVTSRWGPRATRAAGQGQPHGMCCVSVLGSFLVCGKCELCPGKESWEQLSLCWVGRDTPTAPRACVETSLVFI